MRILRRVWPDLSDQRALSLFRKGVAGQWSADSVDWSGQEDLDDREATAVGRILTPVYVGEQTAMAGASAVLLHLFGSSDNAAQRLFLVSFSLDEARHFEVLTRYYDHIGRRPLEARELREMLRYHAALLRERHPVPWMWGILISDLFAKHFYGAFYRTLPKSLIGDLSARILVDEARHQAFAEHYLRSAELDGEMRRSLLALRDELLGLMRRMGRHLAPDIEALGVDPGEFLDRLAHDIETKAARIGLLPGEEGHQHDRDEEALLAELHADRAPS